MIINFVFVFLLGTCIGSFLNVCILRIPKKQTVIAGSSYCYACGHKLNFLDMVPILSYLFLKGRCRYCGDKFSVQYPLVELFSGIMFLLVFIKHGFGLPSLMLWVLVSILIIAAVIDIYHRIIPDGLVITGVLAGIPLTVIQSPDKLINGLIGFLIAGIIMLAIAVVSKGGMGGGDIKLSALMGLYLGWRGVLLALFISFFFGGMTGIFLLLSGRKGRKDPVPFGPFLALGAVLTALWGNELLVWYLGLCR
ncbi:type 4 prepilin peptidase 1 . Aspartic peptidase. MEROPS family A24A [Desulfotomaculum arcticum]|uniref:Prepilin leader peptidase/N-methyltransferase n=1 Tax=Desulfotruncus arcticus DSM 17038 TaxID=1121424 RepID=A0A1I2MQ04_9FIRM|nr:A24 family peptidase [Desulfotruncus arcticus]SFF92980.1 type 4 prepilin peptidase 1 . Aspartic peptidase. MEROPS family A24A [Desulfotomaculum arcticum] [Desulfotruncus arcticus DSM 17038]